MLYLDSSRHLIRVWWSTMRVSLVREMEFRFNFFTGLLRQALWLGVFIFMIDTIFRNTQSLAGWSQLEVLVILALSRLIEGLMNVLFVSNIMELPRLVQKGSFDFFLIRPLPVQFSIAFRRISIQDLGNVLGGIILLGYALAQLGWPSLTAWLSFLVIAGCGIAIYYSLLILIATLVFYLDRLEGLWGFMMLFSEPLTVPFDVFPRSVHTTLTYILPLAFIVFIPAQTLTHRLQWWQLVVGLVLVSLFLGISNLAWRAGLRRYSSASS